ncbi:hypothetical protein N9N28_03915 [Rubripirellula amarantea]|nr:hypothetical protein [Rubripirellula amarantea]
MPITIKCQCGKALKIPDSMAGKAVKCPGCATVIKVPAGATAKPAAPGAAAPQPAAPQPATQRPAAQRPAAQPVVPASAGGGLDDMFDEEGFSKQVGKVCPACAAEMSAGAVLCTKCGFHSEHGVKMQAHMTAGLDIDHGTLALMKAEQDMAKETAMQDKLVKGAGMPWWGLALTLFMIISGITIGVIAVNTSRQVDGAGEFNAVGLFALLAGSAFALVAAGAWAMIIVHAFKADRNQGLLSILPPYTLYYVWKNLKATWRYLAVAVVMGGIAGGLLSVAGGP